MRGKNIYSAVDIGGTKILMLLIDEHGQVLSRIKKATPKPADPDIIVKSVKSTIDQSLGKIGLSQNDNLQKVGICTAGFLDHKSGLVHQSPNLNWSTPVPLQKIMENSLKKPVLIENDANAAVLGETFYGAAIGFRDVIYVTLSTGIGGGLFLDNRLYRGSNGFAGEVGHIKPYGRGRGCKCGGYDCLETWASGDAIARSAASLWDRAELESEDITTAWVFDQAKAGNSLAEKIIDHAVENIGLGLANLVTLLNPACIVIGGGVPANHKDFFKKVSERIKIDAISPSVQITPLKIVGAKLEPDSGIWGMFALMTEQVVN